jgi:hypothetical protein
VPVSLVQADGPLAGKLSRRWHPPPTAGRDGQHGWARSAVGPGRDRPPGRLCWCCRAARARVADDSASKPPRATEGRDGVSHPARALVDHEVLDRAEPAAPWRLSTAVLSGEQTVRCIVGDGAWSAVPHRSQGPPRRCRSADGTRPGRAGQAARGFQRQERPGDRARWSSVSRPAEDPDLRKRSWSACRRRAPAYPEVGPC